MARRRKSKLRAAAVYAASRYCKRSIAEIFEWARQTENTIRQQDGRRLARRVVANLRRVPTYVYRFARALVAEFMRDYEQAPRQRPAFFRMTLARGVH